MELGMRLGLGEHGAPASTAGGSFSEDFSGTLGNWTTEAEDNASASIVSGALRLQSNFTNLYHGRGFYDAVQIPATWQTITIEVDVLLSVAADCWAYAGLCFDEPPTGQANHDAIDAKVQNAYMQYVRGGGYNDVLARHAAGTRTQLETDALVNPSNGTFYRLKLVFTKLADRVKIARSWDGSPVGTDYEDTDASRQTGACYVALEARAWANGGWYAAFDNLDVSWT